MSDCLIVRGGGVLWGVPRSRVRVLARAAPGGASGVGAPGADAPADLYRVEVGGRALRVDEVLGFTGRLDVRPLGAVLRRFWPAPALGIAVHDGRPVVIVDPDLPPAVLVAVEEAHG